MNTPTHGIVHKRSQRLVDFAAEFAAEAHDGQVRKYTGEPYISHPVAVAQIVAAVTDDVEAICAAFLHDVIEDTDTTAADIAGAGFEWNIARFVLSLTDVSKPEDGNRAARKAIDRKHYERAHPLVQTVKLADLIDNTRSIVEHDPNFARVYVHEVRLLLPFLYAGDKELREWLFDQLAVYDSRRLAV